MLLLQGRGGEETFLLGGRAVGVGGVGGGGDGFGDGLGHGAGGWWFGGGGGWSELGVRGRC